MMGHSHAASGTTAFAATAALAPLVGIHPHLPAIAAGTLATAGASLIPDLDHPEATAARVFGPVSRQFAGYVNRVSGGHRHATHSLVFAAGAFAAAWAALLVGRSLFAVPALFVLNALGIRALRLAPKACLPVAIAATAADVAGLDADYGWLPIAVGIGCLVHILGDCLTKEGCPLLWPRRRRYKLPIIQRTGNSVERWIFAPMFIAGTIALLALGH
jgi:membrane-bound metal-dependent hydrolase YbcI (DUF457 family)